MLMARCAAKMDFQYNSCNWEVNFDIDWYRPVETFLIKEKLKLVDVLNLDIDQNQNSKI
jgi:acetolactate synthase regulatory subunit